MPSKLQDKTVLITGAARRVGAEIARVLHAEGASLALHYRSSAERSPGARRRIQRRPARFGAGLPGRPAGDGPPAKTGGGVVEHFGRLDALVNNASSFYATPIGDIGEREWDDLIGTNLKAPLFLSQAAAPHLAAARGCIVNITDIHAERPLKNLPALLRRQGRPVGPDPCAGAGTGAARAGERRRARADPVAGGRLLRRRRARRNVISRTLLKRVRRPRRHRPHGAVPDCRCALRHRPGHRRGWRQERACCECVLGGLAPRRAGREGKARGQQAGQAPAPQRRPGHRRLQHDRGGRPRHGLPLRRQGQLRAARHPAAAARASRRCASSSSPSISTRSSPAFRPRCCPST